MTREAQSTTRRNLIQAGLVTTMGAAGLAVAPSRAAAANGINALIAVSQLKAENASQEASAALDSAKKQRNRIASQKGSRAMLNAADRQVAQLSKLDKSLKDLQAKLKEAAAASGKCK